MTSFNVVSRSLIGLTLVAGATSCHALPFANFLHLHPHAAAHADHAVLRLNNPNFVFRDVKVGDRVYTVLPHRDLTISAPVGTKIYAANGMFRNHVKGALLAQVEQGNRALEMD